MLRPFGPFIGVSSSEVRILFGAEPGLRARVAVRGPSGPERSREITTAEDGIAVATFTGLDSNTRYTYNVAAEDSRALTPVRDPAFHTFPKPGDDADLTFSFFSCHNVARMKPGEPVPLETIEMWKRLGALFDGDLSLTSGPTPRFLLGVGDQIYADELWKNDKPRRAYASMDEAELVREYGRIYRQQLGLEEVRRVTSRCPMFMVWDDHEIRDGWGSAGNEGEPVQQKMFGAATAAYERHQQAHNSYLDGSGRGYYAFVYGRVGFAVLDLRRYRSASGEPKGLLGAEQRRWLEGWLQDPDLPCDVVFIVSSVPFVHLTAHITQMAFGWLGRILLRVAGIADDFVDQWNSEPFIEDARWLAELLFDLSNSRGIRCALLGGDVHVGTFAVIRSYRDQDHFHPAIYQFTSSPISNRPMGLARWLPDLAPEIDFGEDIPFRGRLLKVMPDRNFGLVNVRRNPATGDYGVTLELHCQKRGIQKLPTMW